MNGVIRKLNIPPVDWNLRRFNNVLGTLFYHGWSDALETVVQLWNMVFENSVLGFVPHLSNVDLTSEREEELCRRLRKVFLEKLKQLREGAFLEKWMNEIQRAAEEIRKVSNKLTKPQNLRMLDELLKKKKAFEEERDLILSRVQEFLNGIDCIKNYLKNEKNQEDGDVPVFVFLDAKINWRRIYNLIMRECRRLEDGLPIFGRRVEILKQIHCQQVMVLIGETGSGKSTQLVQFLADSGNSGHGSIVCTQPRKVAAISLAERVNDETCGCYEDTLATCYHTYSSVQAFKSRVVFLTDNCLLRHYMNDRKLLKISCIVVDEAHERSLHTDLLLALIKSLLCERPSLRLIIMSATADAGQLAEYFFGCRIVHAPGRCYPVEIKYVPSESEGFSPSSVSQYVLDVLKMVNEIHKADMDGTILAFLTSQMEVEWACENFHSQSAEILPLHGKLSCADQNRVFLAYPGKRLVIFATNVAETSLTIPGVKYVVDSGMMIESRYEPSTGMNVLKVGRISQSSANQRAGRAGRTEPGTCYRLYRESDFQEMVVHQEPQIRKVHLGLAILKMLALGIENAEKFDFVDAPSHCSMSMAFTNLLQLGAIRLKGDTYGLTTEGWEMVKLGVEPRLAKIILKSHGCHLGREGLVLAAVMANSSSIFCRVGRLEDKLKSDCLKVQFCHPDGDLFTLLAVYKEWESLPDQMKNSWCWQNSINAKSLKRCREVVLELESCLQTELNIIVPTYWSWNPQMVTEIDKKLKDVILSSLPENVAMYSGCNHLGYEVAMTRKHVKLHPSCSLLNFAKRPAWVTFGEVLSASSEYLVCVTACEYESMLRLSSSSQYSSMESQRLQKRILTGFGSVLLKRFCGKFNGNLQRLVSSVRASCDDDKIYVEVNVDENDVHLFASSQHMERVCDLVFRTLEYEKKLMENECIMRCLYEVGPAVVAPVALFGAGAEIKNLELDGRSLTVDIFHSNINALDDKELLGSLERRASGFICKISKCFGAAPDGEVDKWGSVTFLDADAANRAVEISEFELCGGLLKVVPSRNKGAGDSRMLRVPQLKASIEWPRRPSKGTAIVTCHPSDVNSLIEVLSSRPIDGDFVWCERSNICENAVVISRLSRELSEEDISKELRAATDIQILSVNLVRSKAVERTPCKACHEAIVREISPFLRGHNSQSNCVHVEVFEPKEMDVFMKATISFDGDLHLAAASALEHIEGKALIGLKSWQKIRCIRRFRSSVSCSASVYDAINKQLHSMLEWLRQQKGVTCTVVGNRNGFFRVDISARATRTVAEARRPLEKLMRGRILQHPDLNSQVLQILFSRDAAMLLKTTQRETGTYIIFERQNMVIRIFGSPERVEKAEGMLTKGLLALHESRHLEVKLRNRFLPLDMMKRVVEKFGPGLHGLKDAFPGVEFSLNVKRHCIYMSCDKELKEKVERLIFDLANTSESQSSCKDYDPACPICLCEVTDAYRLENCCHVFCRSCLVDQLEFATRNSDSFPVVCSKEGCRKPILLADLRSLLSDDHKLDELFRSSLISTVASSRGKYAFCPSPDCPSIYRVINQNDPPAPFLCGACCSETCARCHSEYHPFISCEKYSELKQDPDLSLKEWCEGKPNVKVCPSCGWTVEKTQGCNHVECRCGAHVCWMCLMSFNTSQDCYAHLSSVHESL